MPIVRALPFALVLVAACGSAPAQPVVAGAEPITANAASPLLDYAPSNARLVARFDARALRSAPLYKASLDALSIAGADKMLDELRSKCGFDVLDAVDEAVVARGERDDDFLIVARVEAKPKDVMACARGFVGVKASDDAPLHVAKGTLMAKDGLVFFGRDDRVEAALAGHGSAPPIAKRLAHGPSTVLAIAVDPDDRHVKGVDASLSIDANELRIEASGEMGSDEEAKNIAGLIRGKLGDVRREFGEVKEIEPYLDALAIEVKGNRVNVAFDQKGGAEAQVKLVGTASAIGIYATRRYLALSKAAEAKSTVGAIARAIEASMEREDAHGKRPSKLPPSAPPTPKDVPRGVKFVPDATTWSHPTWKLLGFEIDSPFYYSYEIQTAPDGKSAVVRAHGDLNGDGKVSTFELTLKLDPATGEVHVAKELAITNELE